MFFFIGGVQENSRLLRVFHNAVCGCGRMTEARLVEYYTCLQLFFLPVFRWNKRYYVISRCCGPYVCSAGYAAELMKEGAAVDFSRMKKKEPDVYYDYRL